MERVSAEFMDEIIEDLQNKKIKYTFYVTGSTMVLKSKFGDFSHTRTGIKLSELPFINVVSRHIKKTKLPKLPHFTKDEIDYYAYANLKGKQINNVFEVDINAAYWKAALNLKIITKSIFDQGMKVDKITRLASLGSLAKNPTIVTFNGVEESYERDKPAKTSYIWFAICNAVAEAMTEAKDLLGKDFIFFWVDGIYFRGKHNIKMVHKIFSEYNFESKLRKIDKLKFDYANKHIIICEKGKKERPFPLI